MKRLVTLCTAVALSAALLVAGPAGAKTQAFTYLEMADGVLIAVAIEYPEGFSPDDEGRWPAVFMMDGYEGASLPILADYGPYVTVHASIRGTGCSGGRFELFDRRHAWDGHEIIEWVGAQPWSNGRVGAVGHSYYGLTAFLVASTSPPSLEAIAVSGLIDDLYRGLTYMGGVPNVGFPSIWTGVFQPAIDATGTVQRGQRDTAAGDPTCVANIAARPPPNLLENPIVRGATGREYDDWWESRSLLPRIDGIRAATHITHQYQDEQTGPRGGPNLWEKLPADVPKRLVLTNGLHNTERAFHDERVDWLDCFLVRDGEGCRGQVDDPEQRVQIHFDTKGALPVQARLNAPLTASDFPLADTAWTKMHLLADGTMGEDEAVEEGSRAYVSVPPGRHSYVQPVSPLGPVPGLPVADANVVGPFASTSGPDELRWRLAFDEDTAIAGPVPVRLWASSTAVDTDVFVQLIDVAPDGSHSYLQRGMLRASHRAVEEHRSDRIRNGTHDGEIYRPHHAHTNPTLLTPGEAYELLVEVHPVSHVFRAGHELVVRVSSTPAWDSLYAYEPAQAPAVNTILTGPAHPSSLLLPVLPDLPPLTEPPACGDYLGVRCVQPAA